MEGDEIQMGREELQKWVRRKVRKNKLMISDVLEKCNLLQSLLERREKQAAQLLRLCRSVSACEATVKKQYALLGWKYRDTDSDDDDNITGCGNTVPSPPSTNGPTPLMPKLQYSENLHRDNSKIISLKGKPVVVLTRLPSRKIRSLSPPTPPNPPTTPPNADSEDASSHSDSDVQWEPQDDSSDYDNSLSSYNSGSNKRRKIDQQNQKPASHTTAQASTSTDAQSNVTEASIPPDGTNSNAKSNVTEASTLPGSANPTAKSNLTKAPSPSASTNGNTKSNVTETSTPPANTNAVNPVCVTALRQTAVHATKTPRSVLHDEPKVDMTVLARQRAMNWQQGKITEIITEGDGLKYKIHSEETGKSLVSGHHIAFDYMPKVNQLFVGARVLVRRQTDLYQFCAGILGELPSRKNRMRFLVFSDDHTPAYVGLPLLRLVCRPLTDPLDDVPDGFHKDFLKEYLEAWPYPRQTQFKVGQGINAQFNGVMQRCDVKTIVGSLIQVVVSTDKREEWIYKGSPRLQNMTRLRKSNKKEGQDNKSPKVDESSKSAR